MGHSKKCGCPYCYISWLVIDGSCDGGSKNNYRFVPLIIFLLPRTTKCQLCHMFWVIIAVIVYCCYGIKTHYFSEGMGCI